MLLRIGKEPWWISLYANVRKLYLHAAPPLCVFLMRWSFLRGLMPCKHTQFVPGSLHLTVSYVHTSTNGCNFLCELSLEKHSPYNYCTWQVMIVILAWISRAVTCCAYRTGPERAQDFLSGSDGGEQRTTRTHTEWPLATHWLTSTVIYVHATDVGCDRACACVAAALVCGVGTHTHTPSANSTPPRPSRSSVRPRRANMKLDTTAGGWQRRLEQLPEPRTPRPSPPFCSSPPALGLIMPSQSIYTTTQAWIHRVIPCAAPRALHLSSSRPHGYPNLS